MHLLFLDNELREPNIFRKKVFNSEGALNVRLQMEDDQEPILSLRCEVGHANRIMSSRGGSGREHPHE